MAVNAYITLDGKQYPVSITRYEPVQEKIQNVHVSVGGAHVSQHFNFVEQRWGFDLRVLYNGDATWGDVADLQIAYAKEYVSFTDHYGTTVNVFMEGPLPEVPDSMVIGDMDTSAKCTMPVNLRKKQ